MPKGQPKPLVSQLKHVAIITDLQEFLTSSETLKKAFNNSVKFSHSPKNGLEAQDDESQILWDNTYQKTLELFEKYEIHKSKTNLKEFDQKASGITNEVILRFIQECGIPFVSDDADLQNNTAEHN